MTTVNLAGTLRILDINQNKEKSWISALIEPQTHTFKRMTLAAVSKTVKGEHGNMMIIAFNNKKVPYPFVNCVSEKDYR